MLSKPKFIQLQQTFANHIKNPDKVGRPQDVDDRHMRIYRDLFFNNVMGFLNSAFPVLAEIIGEQRWHQIGRDFFSRHHNKTPYFLQISAEFLSYLKHEYQGQASDPDYMYELAHYEWLELYVDVEPEDPSCNIEADVQWQLDGDVFTAIPFLSPVVEGCLYQYPVHQISVQNPSPEARESALIVYRKRDDSIGFAESNAFTLQLLELLKQQSMTGQQLIDTLLSQTGLAGNEAAYHGGKQTLEQWRQLGIIWGVVVNDSVT